MRSLPWPMDGQGMQQFGIEKRIDRLEHCILLTGGCTKPRRFATGQMSFINLSAS